MEVRRGGGGGLVKCVHLQTGGGVKRGHFLGTSFMDDPYVHTVQLAYVASASRRSGRSAFASS